MKVKCVSLIDKVTGESADKNDWLTVGDIYSVVFIEKPKGKNDLYRIIGDDAAKKPMLFDSTFFKVISESESEWVSEMTSSGTYRSGPKEFMVPGFWGNLFDGEPEESAIFRRVMGFG